ncbi:RecX family transcriptional regulator [Candidatus Sumerlaeota bacterium]|nr:RecX family transcriptional regulator [Candidatus Sumerlaeota bacterium]
MDDLRILRLQVVKRRAGERVVVELDNGSTVEVDPEIVVRCGVKSGAAISAETVERLRYDDELLRARRRLTKYLSLRVKSVADARLYLERAGFRETIITAAIADTAERDLLDDQRFAERYVRTKLKTATVGPLRLVAELTAHGVDPSLAERVVAPQYDRAWQLRAAERLLRKRSQSRSGTDDEGSDKRLYEFLRRRGFEEDVARELAQRSTW